MTPTMTPPPTVAQTAGGASVKATKQRVKVGEATRVVYKGPRGGRYVRKDGKLVPVKDAKAAAAKKASASKKH